ncbi:DUF6415 family natural product biosynthesis protein [Streptomyces clavifer]|uniref:DUF6415 family natural product biosynthesis protein n=1 Tax=Streptomyces clavifer TaxID=68188 RepID=UPI003660A96E
MHTSSHTVLYDPDGLIEAQLPLDREPYECLVTAVLAWTGQDTLTTRDLEQIALQLTGHARAVAADVRRRADRLPKDSGPKALADVILCEAEGWLSTMIEGTVRCAQNRARFVRALYARLDRLETATGQSAAPSADQGVSPSHTHGPPGRLKVGP